MRLEVKKNPRSWLWGVGGVVGLALVMMAVMLWSSGPGGQVPVVHAQTATPTVTNTPTVTPTPNPDCVLNVIKKDSPDPVPEGGQITYTITVENNGEDNDGECGDLTVTDEIPTDTDCVSATVTDDAGLDFDIDGCDASGDVVWDSDDELATDDEVVLQMVVKLTSGAEEDDEISNEACATSRGDVAGDCDTEKTDVGKAATATPTTAPTATPRPTATYAPPVAPPPVVLPPPPTAAIVPLVAPPTGSGSTAGGGSMNALALALGLAGGCLILISGAATIRMRRPR